MKNCTLDNIVDFNRNGTAEEAVEHLKNYGVVILRNSSDPQTLDALIEKTKKIMSEPALLGTSGYFMKDPHKMLCEGFMVGREALEILLDERILDVCETYLNGDILLQEMMVKHDLGDNELYFPMHAHTGRYRTVNNPGAFSVGIMMYTHDTEAGAFCYAPKTHLWDVPHGDDPNDYPEDMKRQIDESYCRIAGKRGDIVLFDHRGFHGPEQPVTVPRTVFLGGFHDAKSHGNKVKTATAVFANDLAGLSERQWRVMGLKSDGLMISRDKAHYYSFDKANPRAYKLLKTIAQATFALDRGKFKAKRHVKEVLGKHLGYKFKQKIGAQEKE